MDQLLLKINRVEEEGQELEAREFQMAVMSSLLQVMREQETIQSSLVQLTKEQEELHNSVTILTTEQAKERQEEEEVMEEFFSEELSSDEEEEESVRKVEKEYRSGTTQTSHSNKILYYHETKQVPPEEGIPLLEDGDDDQEMVDTEKVDICRYKWKRRIPASRFGTVVKAEGRRKDPSFSDDILNFDFSGDTEATKYGKNHEKDAVKKLEQILGVEVEEPKKYVDKENKFLVCIPDGLIGDDKLVEIKCPYKCSQATMESLARTDDNFCLQITDSGRLKLKEYHEYYYQVQGELNICQREVCYFVVWSPTEFHYQVIERDQHFWDVQMFPWLLDFYRIHILEERWNFPDVSEEELRKRCNDVLRKLQTSHSRQAVIERATRGQGINPEWVKERKERLTASNFGRVAKMRATTSCHSTVISILYPDKLDNLEAIRWGKENEKKALEELNMKLLDRLGEGIEECGLFVDTNKGYLAASPDGTVGRNGLVEVKCPLKCRDSSLISLASRDSSFCLQLVDDGKGENGLRLKRNHNYYYQIQGQLHIANRSCCYFMVWSPHEPPHVEVVEYDTEFWEDIEEVLDQYYINCLLPEIVDPRAPRGMKVREPEYILQAQNLKNMKI